MSGQVNVFEQLDAVLVGLAEPAWGDEGRCLYEQLNRTIGLARVLFDELKRNRRPSPWIRFDPEDQATWPDTETTVFVWDAKWKIAASTWLNYECDDDGPCWEHDFDNVTHWCPTTVLPEPPKEEA